MIIHGSLKHTTSGRRIRSTTRSRRSPRQNSLSTLRVPTNSYAQSRMAANRQYQSRQAETLSAPADTSYKQEVSSNYTISIPYNKGAYQVIPVDDIKKIGR